MGTMTHTAGNSSSASVTPRRSDLSAYSQRDLASLQRYLDGDFQNFWNIRRFGKRLGTVIQCACCDWAPPKAKHGEDLVWYSYRKYRALCEHLFSAHLRKEALTHRRIAASVQRKRGKQTVN
jgi:hypothetical protein